jgi:O-antigen/teichoic acid export membrane protein
MHKTLTDISSNFLNRVVVAVINLIAIPFLLDNLGAFEFGVFSIYNILIMFFVMSDFGLSKSGVRFITLYFNKPKIKEIYASFIILTLLSCLLLIIVGDLLSNKIILFFDLNTIQDSKIIYYLTIVIGCMLMIRGFFISVIFSFQNYKFYNWINIFIETVRWSGTIYVSFLENPLQKVFIVQASTYIFHNLILCIYSIKLIKIKNSTFKIYNSTIREILHFSSQIALSDLFQKIMSYSDKIIVSILGSISGLSFYYIAFQVISKLYEIPGNILLIYYTRFGISFANKKKTDLLKDYEDVTRITLIIIVPLLMNLFFLSDFILDLWLTSDSIDVISKILKIFCLGALAGCLTLPSLSLSNAIGKPKFVLFSNIYTSILLLSINIILISFYGIYGAAFAWSIVQFFPLIYLTIKLSKSLEFNYNKFMITQIILPFAKMTSIYILCYLINIYLIKNIFIFLAASNTLLIFSIYFYVLSNRERNLIKKILKKNE